MDSGDQIRTVVHGELRAFFQKLVYVREKFFFGLAFFSENRDAVFFDQRGCDVVLRRKRIRR
ncbi:hypothetical protein D3C83_311570 [compost metagenome]